MRGYIKLYRQIADNPIWRIKPFSEGQAWVDMLCITNYEKGFIKTKNGEIISLECGDCGYSVLTLSERWGWSRGKVKRFLNLLETQKMIQQKMHGKLTIISILNFGKYQNRTTNDTTNNTTNGQQTDTINNEKNEKNIIEEEEERAPDTKNWYGEYSNVHLDNEQLGKLKSLILNDDFLFFLIDELSSNIAVGRAPRYDESQPWCHFAMVKKYWNFRKQNPGKFTKKTKKEGETTAQIYVQSKQRMLETMAEDDII